MILPTKHLPSDRTLLAAGARILRELQTPATVSVAWDRVRTDPSMPTFDRFVLALDFLFALGLVSLQRGRLTRTKP